jgi:hypothetical protein
MDMQAFLKCIIPAHWNDAYYKSPEGQSARDQEVWALNLRSGQIRKSKVGNLHFQNGTGTAEITAAEQIELAKQSLPPGESLDDTIRELEEYGDMTLDIENLYVAMERSHAYRDAMRTIRENTITSPMQKGNVAIFMVSCRYRHPTAIREYIREIKAAGGEKWHALIEYKKLWASPHWLTKQSENILGSKWILHRSNTHTFPLPDYAALQNAITTVFGWRFRLDCLSKFA